jgi:SAM-dependent methyltransferase
MSSTFKSRLLRSAHAQRNSCATEWSGGSEPAGLQGSYVKTNLGLVGRLDEFWNLFLIHGRDNTAPHISRLLEEARARSKEFSALLGAPVAGLKMLEIGPGQQLVQLAYFGTKNEVVGIDLDVIMLRLNLGDCLRILKQNGWLRTCKTVGRKLARIDVRARKELALQLGLRTIPDLRVLQMDATKMSFPDNEFDVVFSRAVFEHLPNPAAVVSEIRRVLKPGGSYVYWSSFVYMRQRRPRHAHLIWPTGQPAVLGAFATGA